MRRAPLVLSWVCTALVLAAACAPAPAVAPPTSAVPPPSVAPVSAGSPASVAASPAVPVASPVAPSPAASPSTAAVASAPPVAAAVPPVPGSSPTTITFCIPSKSDTILPVFAAEDAGYFKQENLDATLPFMAGGLVDSGLAAGQCNFVFGAGGVGPLLQGVDVRVIAVTTATSIGQLWGRPPATSVQDMRGKTIATSGAGSLSYRLARWYLQLNGIDPDTDATVIGTGSSTSTLGAVTTGGDVVAGALLTPPDTFKAPGLGLTLLYQTPASLSLMNTGVVTTGDYLSAHPDVAAAVVKAVCDAMDRLVTDQDFYGQELAKLTGETPDPATVNQYWTNAAKSYTLPPRIDHAGAVRALQLYADPSQSQDLDAIASQWIDLSIVDRLFPGSAGS